MREIEFVNDLRSNFLTIPYEGKETDFALRMMTENASDVFLPIEMRHLDGETFLYYDISGMQNMEILYGEKPIDRQTFQTFMWQLHRAIEESRELFLPGDGICLDPRTLFRELGTEQWKFIYIPGPDTEKPEEMRGEREKLAEYLVMHMDYEDKELTDTVYDFYEEICAGRNFPWEIELQKTTAAPLEEKTALQGADEEQSVFMLPEPEEFEEEEMDRSAKDAPHHGGRKLQAILCAFLCAAVIMTVMSGKIMPEMMIPGGAASALLAVVFIKALMKRKDCCKEEDFGGEGFLYTKPEEMLYGEAGAENGEETNAYVEEERTVYMDIRSMQERKLYGIGKWRRQKFFLEKLPCLVGKDKTLVDHVVEDPSVSRMHAKFYAEKETIWMQDLNSTNGTYHNGMRLSPNEKVSLEPEDEIGFGQAQFVFR